MIGPQEEPSTVRNRRNALREEQTLCNEALLSREFDGISDTDWVAMCEQVAANGRNVSPSGDAPPDAAPEPLDD